MDLDRTSIERTEFPLVTPGYEPAAVQAHLRAVAEEVEALRRSGFRPGDSLALTASAEVRAVLEAAEHGAQAIRARAEEEAATIVAEAEERALAGAVEVGQADRARLAETLAGITRALGEMLDGVGQLTSTLEGLAAPPVADQTAEAEEQPDEPAPTNGAAHALPPLEPLPATRRGSCRPPRPPRGSARSARTPA